MIMCIAYILLIVYFRKIGGYRAKAITETGSGG